MNEARHRFGVECANVERLIGFIVRTMPMTHLPALFATLLLAQAVAPAADDPLRAAMDDRHKALLSDYCARCHGAEKQKGKFRVDDLPFAITNVETAERWQKVLNHMNSGEMPPDDEKQPDGCCEGGFSR